MGILDPKPQTVAGLDAAVTAKINDTASASRAALNATYAGRKNPPVVQASKNGIKYDGTDETAAFQALINSISAFGGGVIEIENVIRCDGQITFPTNVAENRQRMAPIRLTGTVQSASGAWPPFTGQSPYPKSAGLDLRYAGRTDAGCATTKGSAFITNPAATAADRGLIVTGPGIPDQAWILHVKPGVGWIVSKSARATAATVSLNSTGGRLQGFGYGMLEIDRLQLMNNGAASSSPFGLTTGPSVRIHDNTFIGHATKGDTLCDEDVWVFGGPGQGTILTAPLNAGTAYTTLTVAPLPVEVRGNGPLTIGVGTSQALTVTTTATALAGATSISVQSFTPTVTRPADTSVYIGNCINETTPNSFNVPSAPFQGYASHVFHNHFTRVRRIAAGGFASDVYIDGNAWMHNCGSNLAASPSTLTTALTSGTTYTTLAVTALSRAVVAGDVIQVGVGGVSQETIASADAAAGAVSISVNSFVANASYSTTTKVYNATAGIGAMVESYAIDSAANAITITNNRMGFSGGYTHASRFAGQTLQSNIISNNFQDHNLHANNIAGFRFDRGATDNLIITGLGTMGGLPLIDDWSRVEGYVAQTVMESGGGGNSFFQGLRARDHIADSTPAAASTFQWQDKGVKKWQLYGLSNDAALYLRDMTNSRMLVTYRGGATNLTSDITCDSNVKVTGYFEHTGAGISFFGAPLTGKPSLTYSRAIENAAQTQIRTALAALGLVADNTTA